MFSAVRFLLASCLDGLIRKSITRIPHFAETYFNFYSLMLWSHDFQLFAETRSNSNTSVTLRERVEFRTLSIIENNTLPQSYPLWIKELVRAVDGQLNIKTVTSRACYGTINAESKGWFLHPSDALLLGSYLANEDVCKYKGAGRDMLSDSYELQLGILDRRLDRRLLNHKTINEYPFMVGHIKIYLKINNN